MAQTESATATPASSSSSSAMEPATAISLVTRPFGLASGPASRPRPSAASSSSAAAAAAASHARYDQSGVDDCEEEGEEEEEEHDPASYRLLELPDDVLRLIEEAAERRKGKDKGKRKRDGDGGDEGEQGKDYLVINGRHNDEAVLCTSNRTYALREISQSNSLLLCNVAAGCSKEATASQPSPSLGLLSNVSTILELVPVVPRLERLNTLLRKSAYQGERAEQSAKRRGEEMRLYTPREVASIVQASAAELERGFRKHHVVELDGHLRQVASSLIQALLKSLLLNLEANAYLPRRLPWGQVREMMLEEWAGQVRPEVVDALVTRWFGRVLPQGSEKEAEPTVRLHTTNITRFLGSLLLSSQATTPISLDSFLSLWRSEVTDSLSPKISLPLLKGLYLLTPSPPLIPTPTNPRMIQYFPASQLPLHPASRFQELFLTRPSWTLEDLVPFLEDLTPSGNPTNLTDEDDDDDDEDDNDSDIDDDKGNDGDVNKKDKKAGEASAVPVVEDEAESRKREGLLLRFTRAKKEKMMAVADSKAGGGGRGNDEVVLYSARIKY